MLLVLETAETVGATVSRTKVAETDHSVGSEFVTQTVTRLDPSESASTETEDTTFAFAVATFHVSTGVQTPQEAVGPAYTR